MNSLSTLALALALVPAAALAGGDGIPSKEKHPMDPVAPKPAGEMVDLTSTGKPSLAYRIRPAGPPAGAVLVFHEWWGLNDHVKAQADELAKMGYVAIAVDLYAGKVAKTPDEAGAAMKALDQKRADDIAAAAIARLRADAPGVKLATIGWCMGGTQSLFASLANASVVSATVVYYGGTVEDVAKLKVLKSPLLGIYAKKDGWITPEVVAAFDKALTAAGVKHDFHSFDADHAFANPSGGRSNPQAAKDAWALVTAFLAANLR